MNDELGDRMKMYEGMEAHRTLMPGLPILARLDGKGFSRFTEGFERPYDVRMSTLMKDTTRYLVQQTNARCGYTQSDEITLLWFPYEPGEDPWFGGRIQKLNSVLAAMATAYFNWEFPPIIKERAGYLPVFDCRVWNVPTRTEAANAFLWRELDATKNSVSMAARAYYEHSELQNKTSAEMQEMLFQKGINWNDYPAFFKRGTYFRKRVVTRKFLPEEIDKLPEKHAARKDPDLTVTRTIIVEEELPKLSSVKNRQDVIFDGAVPILE